MKNKLVVAILCFLLVLSTTASVIGIMRHNKNDDNTSDNTPKTEVITYEYYIENVLQDKMPTQTTVDSKNNTIKYQFSRYQCDNNVTGTFDEDKWKFIPKEEKKSTCKIYFVKSFYEVTLSATNGVVDPENETTVEREKDGQFKVTPNEGYEFKSVTCTNDKDAIYDKSTSTLNINVVMEDVACKVDFVLKTLKMDVTVVNGKGNTTENSNYGESVSATVEPSEGYGEAKTSCTNDQTFIFENNKITIGRLTDDTVCTIEFTKAPAIVYKLKIETIPETVKITAGSNEQSIMAGKDGKFSLKPDEGYEIKLDCGGIKPSSEETTIDGSTEYTFLSMSKDITCNVTATSTSTANNE